jgi:hypothetical protein
MADFKDVYSLEFNASQFSAEVDAAIGKIEDLTAAIEDGADSADQLAAAQNDLTMVLGKEAKGVEQLNQKRTALVKTQGKLNKETKTGAAVTNELANTEKKLAVETGTAAVRQKSLASQFMSGVRSINSMKRAAGLLVSGFRLLAAALPFGLILAAAGPILSFFSSMFRGVDKNAEAMEKLKDESLGYNERIVIIQDEIERLNILEGKRGYLTEEEKQQRQELTDLYKKTANEIVKAEEDRFNRIEAIQDKTARFRAKLLGDTVAGVQATFEAEKKISIRENDKKFKVLLAENLKLNAEYKKLTLAGELDAAAAVYQLLLNNADERASLQQDLDTDIKELKISANKEIERIIKADNDKKLAAEKKYMDDMDKLRADFEAKTEKDLEDGMKQAMKATEEEIDRRLKAEQDLLDFQTESKKGLDDSIQELKDRLNEENTIKANNRQAQLALDLLAMEQMRNSELLAAFGNAEAQAQIDKKYSAQRVRLENEANAEIIQSQIKLLEKLAILAKDNPLLSSELKKQIAEFKLQLAQLGKEIEDGTTPPEDLEEKWKKALTGISNALQIGSDAVFQVLNAQISAYISNLDKAADKSKSALDEIRANSEDYNARQLEMEKERLEKLEQQREEAIEKEKRLAQIQLVINSTLAIAKAAAEGGAAAPFTIAATLVALIAGFASARATANGAFFDGTEYLQRGGNPSGRDTIPIWANEGEAIIPTQTNSEYRNAVSAIYNKSIPADVLNQFASAYKQGGLQSALSSLGSDVNLNTELGGKSVFVNVGNNFSGLESRLERIENALIELPKYMPRTTVTANANGIFKTVEARMARARFSKDRAK